MSAPKPSTPIAKTPGADRVTIAVVEDHAETRALWRGWIEDQPDLRWGAGFASAEEAWLAWVQSTADVAVIDLSLPGASGDECVRRLKRRFHALRCLVATVKHDAESIFAALKAGADGYWLKSTKPGELIEAIRDVRSERAPLSPAVSRKILQYFHQTGAAEDPGLARLTEHEHDVLTRVSRGALNKEIANDLGVSINAVKHVISNIYRKLEVSNRIQAAARLTGPRPKTASDGR